MYVCVCKAVTDKQIRAAAEEGARTLRDLRAMLEVATQCGRCAPCARRELATAVSSARGLDEPVGVLGGLAPAACGATAR